VESPQRGTSEDLQRKARREGAPGGRAAARAEGATERHALVIEVRGLEVRGEIKDFERKEESLPQF